VATQYAPTSLLPRGRPRTSRAAEQTQRSSTFPRRIRSYADRCAFRPRWVKRPDLALLPWSDVRVTCDVGYLCANFSFSRILCSRVRPDVRDRQTHRQTSDRQTLDVRQKHYLMPRLLGAGHNKGETSVKRNGRFSLNTWVNGHPRKCTGSENVYCLCPCT